MSRCDSAASSSLKFSLCCNSAETRGKDLASSYLFDVPGASKAMWGEGGVVMLLLRLLLQDGS
jgi:hypothetical protein